MFFQGGLLIQSGVAHVFINGVYCHLGNVLSSLEERREHYIVRAAMRFQIHNFKPKDKRQRGERD